MKSPSFHGRQNSKSEGHSLDLGKDPSTCVIQKKISVSRKGGCTQGTATGSSSRSPARSLHQGDSLPVLDIKKEKINSPSSVLKDISDVEDRKPSAPSTTLPTVNFLKSPSLPNREIQYSPSPHNLEMTSPSSHQKSSSRENLSSPHIPGLLPAPVPSPWRNPSPPGSPSCHPALSSQQESPLPQCLRRNPSTPGSPARQPALSSQQPCPQPDSRPPSRSQPGLYSPSQYSQALHFSLLPQGSTSPMAISRNPSPPSPTPPTTPGNPEDNFWEA